MSRNFRAKNPLCASCNRPGEQVDHIIPISQDGAVYDERNLQTLCFECHDKKTKEQKKVKKYRLNSDYEKIPV